MKTARQCYRPAVLRGREPCRDVVALALVQLCARTRLVGFVAQRRQLRRKLQPARDRVVALGRALCDLGVRRPRRFARELEVIERRGELGARALELGMPTLGSGVCLFQGTLVRGGQERFARRCGTGRGGGRDDLLCDRYRGSLLLCFLCCLRFGCPRQLLRRAGIAMCQRNVGTVSRRDSKRQTDKLCLQRIEAGRFGVEGHKLRAVDLFEPAIKRRSIQHCLVMTLDDTRSGRLGNDLFDTGRRIFRRHRHLDILQPALEFEALIKTP